MNQYTIYLPIVSNQQQGLKDLFGEYGIQFGFSVSSASFKNAITRPLVVQHANIVTPEVALKMEFTQPQQGMWDFTETDMIVAFAKELGISVHGHTLSWHMQNPEWLVAGTFTSEQLHYILRTHVRDVSYYFRNKMVSFDSANEAYIKPDGGVYGGPWQSLGEEYVNVSFNCALAKTKPMYNSFFPHPEMEYPKALGLLDKGWCDGIGIQLHLWAASYEATLASTERLLKSIRERGSWCRFSEVGVLGLDELQVDAYAAITRLAIKYADVVKGVIIWGVKEPVWRSKPKQDLGVVLFDKEGNPKPAYYAVINELKK